MTISRQSSNVKFFLGSFQREITFHKMGAVFMEMYIQPYIRTVHLLCNKVSGSVSGDVLSLDIPGMFLRKANADWLSGTQYCRCFCRSDNQIYIIRWDSINLFFFFFTTKLQDCGTALKHFLFLAAVVVVVLFWLVHRKGKQEPVNVQHLYPCG